MKTACRQCHHGNVDDTHQIKLSLLGCKVHARSFEHKIFVTHSKRNTKKNNDMNFQSERKQTQKKNNNKKTSDNYCHKIRRSIVQTK